MQYQYKVANEDSLWKLAQEYTKVKTDLSNEQAQKIIRDLNPSMKSLKAGDIINLPFDKGTSAADLKPKTGYEKWQDTVNQGLSDKRWDEYDDIIKTIVSEYNSRLTRKSRYVESPMPHLDWKWIKVIIWTESGGPDNPSWKTRPMQIGNSGDMGYPALKQREGATDIIMDEKLKSNILNINRPNINIKAGTAYLLVRLSESKPKSLRSNTDKKEYSHTIAAGEAPSSIAKKVGSTIEEIKASNPKMGKIIKPGDKIQYHKASMERVITGWRRPITAELLYKRYNVGDLLYSTKLTYIMNELFPKKEQGKQ